MSLFNASDRIAPFVDRQAGSTPPHADVVRRDLVRFGAAAVLDPADVCQDGAAETRRRAGRVVGRDGVFSNGAAGRLRLRPRVEPAVAAALGGDVPSSAARHYRDDAADRHRARMGRPATGWNGALAVRPVCGLHRASVLHSVGQRAVAAELVRLQRAQAGGQSLRALCRIQSRFVCGAVRLSRYHRTVPDAEDANGGLVDRICAAGRSLEFRRIARSARVACRRSSRSR